MKNLKIYTEKEYEDYFYLMKFTKYKEDLMLETNFICLIIKDIFSSGEYTLEGIAIYTNTPIDVVQDIFTSINKAPSAAFFRRVIELHRTIRKELYLNLMKKIIEEALTMA